MLFYVFYLYIYTFVDVKKKINTFSYKIKKKNEKKRVNLDKNVFGSKTVGIIKKKFSLRSSPVVYKINNEFLLNLILYKKIH